MNVASPLLVTAPLAALLEKAGVASLTASLETILPDLPADKRALTLEMLLTHTAGMSMGPAPLPVDKLGNLEECVKAICGVAPESTPGENVDQAAARSSAEKNLICFSPARCRA